ncbi:MAG: ABC transporter permease [Candidatus Marsarchaeota archaeon]|nr:ABC transporter permease [Candidatus Marsarchaeota archaeon]MCL5115109.1 ABC transporter permease [Candidatus Marsarchaeota archaeon]
MKMGLIGDAYTLLVRELLIFKKNLGVNIIRSLIFPLIFIILLGSFGSTPKNVPVAVVNYDNGPNALNFINTLESGGSVVVVSSTTQTAALNLLSLGKVAGVIVIPTGFSSGAASTIYVYLDNSQPQSAEVVSSQVALVASEVGASTSVSGLSQTDPPGLIKVISNYVYGASSNYLSFVVGGLLVMVASFGAVFSSGFTLLSDREMGNLKAFLTTPINQFAVLLSKIGYGTFQSFLSAFIGLIIGLLYGATVDAGVLGFFELIWIIFLVGLGFSALAIALATRMKQLQTYALVSQTLVMPLAFLGGAFVPVTLLPSFLIPLTVVNPLTYAVNAVRDVMIKGFLPVSTLISTSVILVAFAGACMALAFALFRNTSMQLS